MGYIVLSEGYAYLYGALLKKPEKYKEDLVLDNFEAFIKYLGRYTLKPHQNVYSYLFDVIGRLHQMARPMVGADWDNYPIIYAALWGAEVANMPDALKAIKDGFLEGINLNGNKIIPVQQLLARYISPSMIDVLSMLYTKAQMAGKAIEDIGSLGLGLINSIRVAPYIVNDIINNNLRFDKSKDVFKIFAPLSLVQLLLSKQF